MRLLNQLSKLFNFYRFNIYFENIDSLQSYLYTIISVLGEKILLFSWQKFGFGTNNECIIEGMAKGSLVNVNG